MSDLPTSSQSDPLSSNTHHSSHASIALIVTSLFTFLVFFFLSVYRRPSRRARPTPSRSMTNGKSSAKRKPKLWEVYLDEDPYTDFTRLDGAVHNWQVGHHKFFILMPTNLSRDIYNSLSPHRRTIVWGDGHPLAVDRLQNTHPPNRAPTTYHPISRLPRYSPIIAHLMLPFW